ncbi:MAG: HU family DNA-binding protein [Bacteroidales bacterium]|nr:HU family DNA-binding protein [Bacteroidales bacterium]
MDHKQFRKLIADRTHRSVSDVDALIEGLAIIMRESCSDLDSVAIPTFGTFIPVKHPETVVRDLSTGKRMLMPPEISLEFNPGGMFLKHLRHE